MKNLVRFAAPIAGVTMLVLGAINTTEASCPNPRSIGPDGQIVVTPGFPPTGPSTSPDLKGTFWSIAVAPGGGNPTVGAGSDQGNLGFDQWFYAPGSPGFPAQFYSGSGYAHWNAPGVDGCIETDPGAHCMAALFTDDNDSGGGFFALATVGPNGGQDYDFSAATGGAPILLAPVPKPNITSSTRNGGLSVDLTVNVALGAGPANGFYLGCGTPNAGARYRLYKRDQADASPAPAGPDSRSLGNWVAAAGPLPVGTPTQVNVACGGTDREFYLCATVEFPTGNGNFYEISNCSANSTRVECGPNVAEPPARPTRVKSPSRPGTDGRSGR